jgi:hypothetical protein
MGDSLVEISMILLTRVVANYFGVINVLMSGCLEHNVVVNGNGGYAFDASDLFFDAASSIPFANLVFVGDSSKVTGGICSLALYALICAVLLGTNDLFLLAVQCDAREDDVLGVVVI